MKYVYFLLFSILFVACDSNEKQEVEQHHGHHHGHHHDHNKSNKHMNKSSFDDLVARFEDESRADWQKPDEVIALLGDIEEKTILDIGTGTGYFAFPMAEKGANIIAADVDDRFLEYVENRKTENKVENITTRKVPYDSPNLAKAEVDIVIIVNTYHHIENRVDYFKQVLNGLKTDGQLVIVDFKKIDSPHGPPIDHRLSSEEVMEELKKAGFEDFEVNIELLEEQYIIMAK